MEPITKILCASAALRETSCNCQDSECFDTKGTNDRELARIESTAFEGSDSLFLPTRSSHAGRFLLAFRFDSWEIHWMTEVLLKPGTFDHTHEHNVARFFREGLRPRGLLLLDLSPRDADRSGRTSLVAGFRGSLRKDGVKVRHGGGSHCDAD